MYKKLPNILTVTRIFMVPIFPLIYFSSLEKASIYALVFFLFVGATDMLDGYLARKYNLISAFGTAMDPLADKLMLIMVMLSFGIKGLLSIWIISFIIIKELLMIFTGLYFYFKKEKYVIASNIFGKSATMFLFLTILGLLWAPEMKIFVYFVYIAVIMKIIAFISYAITHRKNTN